MVNHQKKLLFSFICILILVNIIVLFLKNKKVIEDSQEKDKSSTTVSVTNMGESPANGKRLSLPESSKLTSRKWLDTEEKGDLAIERMQEILDTNDDEMTLEYASKMAKSTKISHRMKALEALRWVGGKNVVKICAGMLNDDNADVASEAMDVLKFSLDGVDDAEELLPLLNSIILNSENEEDRIGLCMAISNFPPEQSLPFFVSLLQQAKTKNDSELITIARDYIENVTNGTEEIETSEQATAWLKKHQGE